MVSFNPMTPDDPVARRFVDSDRPDVLAKKVSWRDNPHLNDEAHVERQWLERHDPEAYAHIWEGFPRGNSDDAIIKAAWVQSAIDAHLKLGITPTGVRRGALDVADQGRDRNAFAARHGILVTHLESWSGKGSDLFASAERAARLCDEHQLEYYSYDSSGLGAAIRGDMDRINERRQSQGYRRLRAVAFNGAGAVEDPNSIAPGTATKAGDLYLNRKSQGYMSLAARFRAVHRAVADGHHDVDPNDIISLSSKLPELDRLIVELSQPTAKTNAAGKLQIDKYGENGSSPDRADCVMQLMTSTSRPGVRITPEAAALFRDPNWRQMTFPTGPRFRSLPPRPTAPKHGTPEWYDECERTGRNVVGGSGSLGPDELRSLRGGR
jgi:hypothetical protein